MKRISIIIAFLLFASPSFADTHAAASTSLADVQAAINAAVSGDLVTIPSGTATWASAANIPNGKAITLQGAGKTATVITLSGTGITMNESGSRITAIGFIQGTTSYPIDVKGTGWRIDNCKFNNTTGSSQVTIFVNAASISILPEGVIDHNEFINGRILANGFGTGLKCQTAWYNALNLGGTDNTFFVETNTFTRTDGCAHCNTIDSNRGAAYVYRFNWTNYTIMTHAYQAAADRGTRKWEVYNNTFDKDFAGAGAAMWMRGGTGVLFNNTITATSDYYANIPLDINQADRAAGACNGTNQNDNNSNAYGWWCRDQIGTSIDVSLSTTAPFKPQTKQPAYFFLNRKGATRIVPEIVNGDDNLIIANRDYYAEGATFDGTSGVGSGTLASRPATCTTGVAYWATDQGSWNESGSGGQGLLYNCAATNTWSLYYTPYTYPHPLTGAASPDSEPAFFSFTDVTGALQSTVIYSTSIQVLGIDDNTSITSSGANCFYQVNGAGSWLTTGGDNVSLNDNVAMKVTSSPNYSTDTPCILTLNGNVSDTWHVTTQAAVEDAFPPVPARGRFHGRGRWR